MLVLLPCAVSPARALTPVPVARDVYAFVGGAEEPSANNGGNVGNAGFIVGSRAVTVVDTGISHRQGERMVEAIRRVTDKPIGLVIITHAMQEFVFGASAFQAQGATIAAQRETIDLMKARCARCLENLRAILGDELAGSRLVLPARAFDGSTRIESGGTTLELLYFGWASTPGDLVVYHPDTQTAFAGGMVAAGYVPSIRDCDFKGWRAALDALKRLPIRHLVPGFGPVGGAEAIDATAQYLDALDSRMRALYQASSSLMESLDHADLPDYRGWGAYDPHQRQNALHRYLQIEAEDFGADPRSIAIPDRH